MSPSFNGRRQPSRGGTSRISREAYVRFCERLGVKFPGPTRQRSAFGERSSNVRITPKSCRHCVGSTSCALPVDNVSDYRRVIAHHRLASPSSSDLGIQRSTANSVTPSMPNLCHAVGSSDFFDLLSY